MKQPRGHVRAVRNGFGLKTIPPTSRNDMVIDPETSLPWKAERRLLAKDVAKTEAEAILRRSFALLVDVARAITVDIYNI